MNILTHLRELEAKATPGPWEFDRLDRKFEYEASYKVGRPGSTEYDYFISDDLYYNTAPALVDAELIVAMRNALPKLLAFVEAYDAAEVLLGSDETDSTEYVRVLNKRDKARAALEEKE